MNTKKYFQIIALGAAVAIGSLSGCKESAKVAAKTGAQLWGENCQRCHNTPQPTTFSDEQWQTIGMHMQTRALLTENERNKIIAFLQNFNH
jgi:cytochrome c2